MSSRGARSSLDHSKIKLGFASGMAKRLKAACRLDNTVSRHCPVPGTRGGALPSSATLTQSVKSIEIALLQKVELALAAMVPVAGQAIQRVKKQPMLRSLNVCDFSWLNLRFTKDSP